MDLFIILLIKCLLFNVLCRTATYGMMQVLSMEECDGVDPFRMIDRNPFRDT